MEKGADPMRDEVSIMVGLSIALGMILLAAMLLLARPTEFGFVSVPHWRQETADCLQLGAKLGVPGVSHLQLKRRKSSSFNLT